MNKILSAIDTTRGLLRRFRTRNEASVSVEIAMTSLVMIVIFTGLVEFGLMIRSRMEISSGARAGAQYAIADPDDTAGITNAVQNAVNLKAEEITVTVTRYCECPDGTSIDCSDDTTCPAEVRRFVSVEANYDHALVLSYPGVPNPVRVARSAVFRVE